jgi:hypothetical protein
MPQGRPQCIQVLKQNCPLNSIHGIKTFGYCLLSFIFPTPQKRKQTEKQKLIQPKFVWEKKSVMDFFH